MSSSALIKNRQPTLNNCGKTIEALLCCTSLLSHLILSPHWPALQKKMMGHAHRNVPKGPCFAKHGMPLKHLEHVKYSFNIEMKLKHLKNEYEQSPLLDSLDLTSCAI